MVHHMKVTCFTDRTSFTTTKMIPTASSSVSTEDGLLVQHTIGGDERTDGIIAQTSY